MSNDINVKVMRIHVLKNISICDVVMGDVVYLKAGDHISTNGMFFSDSALEVRESSMTENFQVNIMYPFLLSRGNVIKEITFMLATSVRKNTSWGKQDNGLFIF